MWKIICRSSLILQRMSGKWGSLEDQRTLRGKTIHADALNRDASASVGWLENWGRVMRRFGIRCRWRHWGEQVGLVRKKCEPGPLILRATYCRGTHSVSESILSKKCLH